MDEMHGETTGPDTAYTERPGASGVTPAGRTSGKRVFWIIVLVVLAFLGGFGWQYYRAMDLEDQLERTEQALAVERLRVGLAQAAVAAQSGDFEAARRQMSDFFTATQQRLPELPPELRARANELLLQRDDVITGLSRSNPEYATVLYDMLQEFQASLEPAAAVPAEPLVEPAVEADTGAAGG